MMPKTIDAMTGRWLGAFQAYGLTEKQLSGKHSPCPVCGGKDRFRLYTNAENGRWNCNQCGGGPGMKLLMSMTGRSFHEIASDLDSMIGTLKEEQTKARDYSQFVKRLGHGITGISDIDPVSLYLRSRGIHKIPREFLRYNPSVYNWDVKRNYPAMMAAMRDVSGKAIGYHITYLTARGAKAEIDSARMYSPGETGHCVIRLSHVAEHIGLAEGIETALSVTQLYGIPCWATGDAGRMERFCLPAGVERVTIFADMDANHTGESAAEALAKRLIINHRIQCEVRRDCVRGTDYNDLLIAMSKEANHG